MKSLGIVMATRDCLETDYPFRESIAAILPVADQIVVADSESTDGTREVLDDIAQKDRRIQIIDWKWTNPKGDGTFVVPWFNSARKKLQTDVAFQIESDEVIHENSLAEVRDLLNIPEEFARKVKRYNFWLDHRHVAPPGTVCAGEVVRMGPQHMMIPSDCPHPECGPINRLAKPSTVELFHYSFIRERKAFFKKSRRMLDYFFGEYDPLLAEVEHKPEINWMALTAERRWKQPCPRFWGVHPKIMWRWLCDRGWGP